MANLAAGQIGGHALPVKPVEDAPVGKVPLLAVGVGLVVDIKQFLIPEYKVGGEEIHMVAGCLQLAGHLQHGAKVAIVQPFALLDIDDKLPGYVLLGQGVVLSAVSQQARVGDGTLYQAQVAAELKLEDLGKGHRLIAGMAVALEHQLSRQAGMGILAPVEPGDGGFAAS